MPNHCRMSEPGSGSDRISANSALIAVSSRSTIFARRCVPRCWSATAALCLSKRDSFSGHVIEYSGVWKANSKWWDKPWKTQEWDIEIENDGVYRLCKVEEEWFVVGEYD